jgi:hypothetical protein
MPKGYEEEVLKKVNLNLTGEHHRFLQSRKNGCDYTRWMFNNDVGFIKWKKEQEDKKK